MNDFLQSLHPVTAVLHMKVIDILSRYDIKTVLDVGGVGKLNELMDCLVYNANPTNIINPMSGCDLQFEDDKFDAVVSIATLEHVDDPVKFLQECYRVAKKVSVHWFPCGDYAEEVEELKDRYGHWHPCNIPDYSIIDEKYDWEHFMNCGEHLLLCMTLTPSLKNPEVYEYVLNNYKEYYGLILIGEK